MKKILVVLESNGAFMSELKHPGQEILRVINELGMSQKELATRVGVSEKHICTVISGERAISTAFAKKLGYVIKNSSYWLQAQAAYDAERQLIVDQENISDSEFLVYKELKNVIEVLEQKSLFKKSLSKAKTVVDLRSFFKVSDLTLIPKITYNAAYRAQLSKNAQVNPYILYAWQIMCEKLSENIKCESVLNLEKLKEIVPLIKQLMFDDYNEFISALQKMLGSCGISFLVVNHFKGAPVQGFIKEASDKVIMCLTNRRKRADTFWFTLFHEIGHLLNGDIKRRFVDFELVNSSIESKADDYAKNTLIDPSDYKAFVQDTEYSPSKKDIYSFAEKMGVQPFVIVGRLQNDQIIEWSEHNDDIVYYPDPE